MLTGNNYELRFEGFLNIYLEDYNRLKKEAESILQEAELFKETGDNVLYLTYMKKHEAYMLTVEAMVLMVIKKPIAEA